MKHYKTKTGKGELNPTCFPGLHLLLDIFPE